MDKVMMPLVVIQNHENSFFIKKVQFFEFEFVKLSTLFLSDVPVKWLASKLICRPTPVC
jgi:hypothetical protein